MTGKATNATGVTLGVYGAGSRDPNPGQARESIEEPGVHRITVAIGLDDPAVLDADPRIADLERENDVLRARIEALEEDPARLDAAGPDVSGTFSSADAPADD